MTSRRVRAEQADIQMDALIQAGLQERVAERGPSHAAWEGIVRKCADGRLRAISILKQRVLSAWVAGMKWTLPMFEAPTARRHEPYVSGHNVHWTWLEHHRVNVRLAC
jgi:hypothetical protein